MTTILKFKCELLSDVILNQKAASEGPNQTLDFIPGSNFLGIAAGQLYSKATVVDGKKGYMEFARVVFHSGQVRFGDAHPANGENRALRIPAALFFAKGKKEDERTHYLHHVITDDISKNILANKIQLKQERSDFVDFITCPAVRLKPHTNFAVKSAYDAEKRRSKDSQMFGYQSMEKGGVFYFSVEIDDTIDKEVVDKIKSALIGTRHIGRSRSAQYGLVEISECNGYKEVGSVAKADNEQVVVYAESRLIFFDGYGIPTFQPSVSQLLGTSCSGMEIDWSKSQIRTFKYAPYNNVRKCFDTDRCGIEKGSVIVLKRGKSEPENKEIAFPRWVGSYQNEGFGKVIFNPDFLIAADKDAKLTFLIRSAAEDTAKSKEEIIDPKTPLTNYVMARLQRDEQIGEIYQTVNAWVGKYGKSFQDEAFSSQWGQIRNIAMKCSTIDELYSALFVYDEKMKAGGYLVHGMAEDKWRDRIGDLKAVVQKQGITPEHVVNLASIMQKKCSENKGKRGNEKE